MTVETGARVGETPVRRSSYGPTSPTVGPRGAKTQASILDASLRVFEKRGFHDATIQDIVDEVGVSRATLYQYFESKEQIFVELLEECGAAVVDVVRQLKELGPTAEGFANLRWWLAEWARVYDQYATMFVEWANIDTPAAPIGTLVSQFNTKFNRRVAQRLEEAGLSGIDPQDTAIVLTGIILRFNYLRHVSPFRGEDLNEAQYYFDVLIQLMLFPGTPAGATRGGKDVPRRWHQRRVTGNFVPREYAITSPYRERVAGLTARSTSTMHALMKSGARIFAEVGYQRANIDDIVTAAGFARGTFYKYFEGKVDLLLAIADMCAQDSISNGRRLERVVAGVGGENELREWVERALGLSEEYRGVYRVWMERSPTGPELTALRGQVVDTFGRALFVLLSGAERGHPQNVRVSEVFLVALLDQVPDQFALNQKTHSRAYLVDLVARLLERGLFCYATDAPPLGRTTAS